MGLLNKLFRKSDNSPKKQNVSNDTEQQNVVVPDHLMTSQYAALFLQTKKQIYQKTYLHQLTEIGFSQKNAEKMFEFECDVIRKHGKQYLTHPQFTQFWFFGLSQPFFQKYPKTKDDILKEKFFTMSELCKIIDEAEWHFWNSRNKELPDGVWGEICEWRLKGKGAEFASNYFDMIVNETGIPSENIGNYCGLQGKHLDKYKWS